MNPSVELDVAVVGAGFSGLSLLHKLRGLGLTAHAWEAGDGVGGTWYWNRYPGARVDIESQEYSYSFSEELQDDWKWSERYAAQPELLRYLNHVADRFDLRRDITFNTRVASARFDEGSGRWTLTTDAGETISARFCVMATGCLSVPNEPNFPGQADFEGPTYHTGRWPHEGVDFTGKRVAVIGTGSSAIQSIPQIARQAAQVTIFQRTPNYSVPAHNGPIDPAVVQAWNANRAENRQLQRLSAGGFISSDATELLSVEVSDEVRHKTYEQRWARGGFAIRERVKDPAVAEKLSPRGYPWGTKRLCVDIDYYETYNRPNVTLVDLRETPLDRITATGVRTAEADYPADAIVFAIGFDAMTGALARIDIRGREGIVLKDEWAAGPRTYLGLMVAGFPNLFTVTGPGSPSVLSNMVVSIEQHVDWICDCIGYLGNRQLGVIEASPEAQEAWVAHVNEVADQTLYKQANSWYLGANVPGKPRVFMPYAGGVGVYRELCDGIAARGYEGFVLQPAGG